MASTATLATVYELQGLKDEALEIYKEVLKNDPKNLDARLGLRRLTTKREVKDIADRDMKKLFINMDTPIEYQEFERWLAAL